MTPSDAHTITLAFIAVVVCLFVTDIVLNWGRALGHQLRIGRYSEETVCLVGLAVVGLFVLLNLWIDMLGPTFAIVDHVDVGETISRAKVRRNVLAIYSLSLPIVVLLSAIVARRKRRSIARWVVYALMFHLLAFARLLLLRELPNAGASHA